MRHWNWGKVIRRVPEPGVDEPRQISQDQLLADMADFLRCHAIRLPEAGPDEIGRIVRSLFDCAAVIERLENVKCEPRSHVADMALSLSRAVEH